MNPARLAVSLILAMSLASLPVIAGPPGKTNVMIVGEDFHINGKPTYAGRTWNGHRIEGMLLNSRMVQATFDDRNPETAKRWRKFVFAERGAHGSSLPGNSASFDPGRVVATKAHKLIYNALGQLPSWPVDFSNDAFWKELVQMHGAGKLDPKMDRLYFQQQRPMFEFCDLEKEPGEFNNLAGSLEVVSYERELKAAMQEWMILQRDFLPLPVTPTEGSGKKRRQH